MQVYNNFLIPLSNKKTTKNNADIKKNSIQEKLQAMLKTDEPEESQKSELQKAFEEQKAVVTDISEEMAEKSLQFKISMLVNKVKGGNLLTGKEEKFLAEHAPDAHAMAMEVKEERRQFESELKQCKTKKQVKALMERRNTMFASSLKIAVSQNNKSEVERLTTIHNNIKDEHKQFTSTTEYENLPEKSEDDDKKIDIKTDKEEKISVDKFNELVKQHSSEEISGSVNTEDMVIAESEVNVYSIEMVDMSLIEDIPIIQ